MGVKKVVIIRVNWPRPPAKAGQWARQGRNIKNFVLQFI